MMYSHYIHCTLDLLTMSFNDYLQERFEGVEGTEELRDITRHGLSGGVSSFIYNYELKNLYITYEDEILSMCEECGYDFAELAVDCDSLSQLATNAVWMAVENWAHREYENRMTTLEELNDDNVDNMMLRYLCEPMEAAYAN